VTDWAAGDYAVIALELEPAAEQVVEAAGIEPGERVLDVACGNGNAALAALESGAEVTGVDAEPALLAAAAGRPRGARVRWLEGDLLALPVDDGEFDAVVSVFGVMFAPDAELAVAELVRVLSPEGRIVLANWIPEGPIDAAMSRLARALGAPPRGGPSWGSEDDLRALFGPHGLHLRAERHDLVFTGDSAHEWLVRQERSSPALQEPRERLMAAGAWEELRAELHAALNGANEDPEAFAVRSPWLLAVAGR
jgi:SAM-dependent methyltransferase